LYEADRLDAYGQVDTFRAGVGDAELAECGRAREWPGRVTLLGTKYLWYICNRNVVDDIFIKWKCLHH